MRIDRPARLASALLLMLPLVACSGSSGSSDAGPPVDAGPTEDPGPVDAGPRDAGPRDAGPVDAGPLDAGSSDAGPVDAGPLDAGPEDAGSFDAGPDDAGPTDAGPVDAGPVDAGPLDAGPLDAGPVDAGPADAGPADAGPVDAGPMLTLQVAINVNNAISAIATVDGVGVDQAQVTFDDGTGAQATPTFSLAAGPATQPVFGLLPSTHYTLQATGLDAQGQPVASAAVDFTTDVLPAGVNPFTVADGGAAGPGYTLIARVPRSAASGVDEVTLVDGAGQPVWYLTLFPGLVGDFQRQPDHTYTVAQLDQAHTVQGLAAASAYFVQYDPLGKALRRWTAPVGIATDGHELRLQPNGDALLFGIDEQTVDMTAYADGGRPTATVVGDLLERVTPDGGVAFLWDTFGHMSLDDIDPLIDRTGAVVDAAHANSIDVMADGSYLLSLRNMSEVVKVDAVTGDVLWVLGGHSSDFLFVNDPLGGFSLQHGARELPDGHILLFDDGNGHVPPQSRAVEYELDPIGMTATLVQAFESAPPLYGFAMGYAERLPDGHTLVTYGTTSRVQEFDADGGVVWDIADPSPGFGLYRAYRLDSLY